MSATYLPMASCTGPIFGRPTSSTGSLAFDQRRDLRDVHVAVAEGKGHVGVDLEHHRARLGDGGHGVVGAEAEREVAVVVHRRRHAEHDVGRNLPAFDHARDLGEVVGNEVDPARLPARARGAAVEEGHVADVLARWPGRCRRTCAWQGSARPSRRGNRRRCSDSAVSRVGGSPTPVGTMMKSPLRTWRTASAARGSPLLDTSREAPCLSFL